MGGSFIGGSTVYGKFGERFNSANWRVCRKSPNITLSHCAYAFGIGRRQIYPLYGVSLHAMLICNVVSILQVWFQYLVMGLPQESIQFTVPPWFNQLASYNNTWGRWDKWWVRGEGESFVTTATWVPCHPLVHHSTDLRPLDPEGAITELAWLCSIMFCLA